MSGENANKKKALVEWTNECHQAFEQLKQLCSQTPILAYANYKKPFKLHTDASENVLGAVLYQEQDDGPDGILAYASWTLSEFERNYNAHQLEFLALEWSITERFHEYLYGGHFEVYTDNNPFTYILTMAKLDATGKGQLLFCLITILKFSTGVENSMWKWMPYPRYHGKIHGWIIWNL